MVSKDEFYLQVRDFIVSKSGIAETEIRATTALVESGIVDSLLITELIVFVEDVLDIEIDIDTFRVSSFRTIETIYDAYVPGALS